jgi:hypothetical protein
MAFQLIIREDRKTLIVRYYDEVDLANRSEALQSGRELLQETGYRRVMVDLREATLSLPPYDAYTFSEQLTETPELKTSRTAFLVAEDDNSNSFVEIFAGNRGYLYNEFTDEEKAWVWLAE